MKFLYIGLKDIHLNIKDRKAFIGLVITPIILISILGFALSPFFKVHEVVSKFSVVVVNDDNGLNLDTISKNLRILEESKNINLGRYLYKNFKKKPVAKSIQLKNYDYKSAVKAVKKSEIVAVVHIPKDFTKNFFNGKRAYVGLIGDQSQNIEVEVVKEITNAFCDRLNTSFAGFNAALKYGDKHKIKEEFLFMVLGNNVKVTEPYHKVVFNSKQSENKKDISAFQYYAAGIMVMFILFTGSRGVYSIFLERDNGTFHRMISNGVSAADIIIGKFLGILFSGLLQISTIIIITSLVFKISWGSSILGVTWISFASVFCVSGLSILIAAIATDREDADNLNNIGITLMSLIGGSFLPIYSMPNFMRFLSRFTINGETIRGYAAVMQDLGYINWLIPGMYLIIPGVIFLIIGTIRLNSAN